MNDVINLLFESIPRSLEITYFHICGDTELFNIIGNCTGDRSPFGIHNRFGEYVMLQSVSLHLQRAYNVIEYDNTDT